MRRCPVRSNHEGPNGASAASPQLLSTATQTAPRPAPAIVESHHADLPVPQQRARLLQSYHLVNLQQSRPREPCSTAGYLSLPLPYAPCASPSTCFRPSLKPAVQRIRARRRLVPACDGLSRNASLASLATLQYLWMGATVGLHLGGTRSRCSIESCVAGRRAFHSSQPLAQGGCTDRRASPWPPALRSTHRAECSLTAPAGSLRHIVDRRNTALCTALGDVC